MKASCLKSCRPNGTIDFLLLDGWIFVSVAPVIFGGFSSLPLGASFPSSKSTMYILCHATHPISSFTNCWLLQSNENNNTVIILREVLLINLYIYITNNNKLKMLLLYM